MITTKKQAKGLMEVILQNGCSREKEGSEPENTSRSSCFWKIQIVSAKASARRVFGASGRHVGLPRGTGRANRGNNVKDTVGEAAGSQAVRAHGSSHTDATMSTIDNSRALKPFCSSRHLEFLLTM